MSHLDEGQLHELLDGELDDAARAAALSHLASCERCKAAYEEAKSFLAEADELIETIQVPAAAVVLAEAAAPAMAASLPAPTATVHDITSAKRIGRYRTLAWAASVVLAVGLGWIGSSMGSRRPQVASEMAKQTGPSADAVATQSAPAEAGSVAGAEADQVVTRQRVASPEARRDAPAAAVAPPPPTVAAAPATEPLAEITAQTAKPKPEASGLLADKANTAMGAAAPAPAPPAAAKNALQPRDEAAPSRSMEASADVAKRRLGAVSAFRQASMEEAVRISGGSIRLIDGMTPTRILTGAGSESTLIRVVYEDPPGRELWLDQRRPAGKDEEQKAGYAATTLLQGDTLLVVKEAGARSLGWVDQHGFQLRLTGFLATDSLQALQGRVR